MRRCLCILLIVCGSSFLTWEGYRGFLFILLRRGDYARLESWGGDRYFIPALRHSPSRQEDRSFRRYQLIEWGAHRYGSQFQNERVQDLAWLPTSEVIILLRRNEVEDEARIVILDPARADTLVATSETFELNGWGMEVLHSSGWGESVVLVHGGGTMTVSLALRRQGGRILPLPSISGHDGDPYFFGDTHFEDLDGDGVPEVQQQRHSVVICPNCGREAKYNIDTWKLVDGAYRRWSQRGGDCGPACEVRESN